MTKRMRTILALIVAVIALVALAMVVYLAFFFPKLVNAWSATGQALTMVEKILSEVSFLCRSYGLILLPLLIGGFLGCILWAVISAQRVDTKR